MRKFYNSGAMLFSVPVPNGMKHFLHLTQEMSQNMFVKMSE
jgi:hypothetical protein